MLGSCRGSLSPLSNKLDIGEEAYVIFAADGEAGVGDLFASSSAGGTPYQVTFTRVDERLPSLSPDGVMLAFVRAKADDNGERWLVVMNLVNGAERRVAIAGSAPEALAWTPDGSRIYLRIAEQILVTPTPPGDMALGPVNDIQRPAADSALAVLLGDPPLGVAVGCDHGGICVRLDEGPLETISAAGAFPARWSGDSLAYLEGGDWVIRPLAGGRTRVLRWTRAPSRPRELTLFRGRARR